MGGKGGGGGISFPDPWTFIVDSGLDDINVDSESKIIGDRDQPIATDSKSDSQIAVTGDRDNPIATDNKSDSQITLTGDRNKPISTDSKIDANSKSEIDLKPLAIDSCQTIKLAPLPPICVEQPYSQHFGLTYMGIELWGFTVSGNSKMNLHSPPKQQYHNYTVGSVGSKTPYRKPSTQAAPEREKGGLRVKIGN